MTKKVVKYAAARLCAPAFVGMVFTIQFCQEFSKVGLTRAIGGLLGLAFARELTPVICAIVLAGRVGSAIAAELGTMQARGGGSTCTCSHLVFASRVCITYSHHVFTSRVSIMCVHHVFSHHVFASRDRTTCPHHVFESRAHSEHVCTRPEPWMHDHVPQTLYPIPCALNWETVTLTVRSTTLFKLENRNWTRLVQKPNWTRL